MNQLNHWIWLVFLMPFWLHPIELVYFSSMLNRIMMMIGEGDDSMRIADWLTYTDIEQLKELNRCYGLTPNHHSKHDLICSLLSQISQKNKLEQMVDELTASEHRFLQLILLDHHVGYSIEELLARGRMALQDQEGTPRSLVIGAIRRGWLFPGFSSHNHDLYHMPTDLKKQLIGIVTAPFLRDLLADEQLDGYRNEMNLMWDDLIQFLRFTERELVRLTQDGAIYKQLQKKLFQSFSVVTKPLEKKEPRFGFGRSYHLYPDRFSLIYDYAYYQGYIQECENGILCLTPKGQGKCTDTNKNESLQDLYRFWIRLYRRPIAGLPIILRWIGVLAQSGWISLTQVHLAVRPWLKRYYNETEDSLFRKTIQMLLHLGVVQLGKKDDLSYLNLTEYGRRWMNVVSVFDEPTIEKDFYKYIKE